MIETLPHYRQLCQVTKGGVNLLSISEAAEKIFRHLKRQSDINFVHKELSE
ncbi:hypothetical protein [Parapedobacter tibetensis]|uniref:hypothetical protein n=1 Tax=Parapedobacter tibetensis TaxID=2972951 RepID=UPI00214D6A30|nr:hypothetical protein [Parapedobacter tibetensis]